MNVMENCIIEKDLFSTVYASILSCTVKLIFVKEMRQFINLPDLVAQHQQISVSYQESPPVHLDHLF